MHLKATLHTLKYSHYNETSTIKETKMGIIPKIIKNNSKAPQNFLGGIYGIMSQHPMHIFFGVLMPHQIAQESQGKGVRHEPYPPHMSHPYVALRLYYKPQRIHIIMRLPSIIIIVVIRPKKSLGALELFWGIYGFPPKPPCKNLLGS